MNQYPIVLSHGIAPFGRPETYFKGIAVHLRALGYDAYHTKVSFARSLKERATDLAMEIRRILFASDSERVHIVAHSMGGLDARYAIAQLGMDKHVASLTTIGTPHAGTPFADWGVAHKGDRIISALRSLMHFEGFFDLTTDACRKLNLELEPIESGNPVHYIAYSSHEERRKVFAPLRFSWELINQQEGPNDGLVPVSSQRWKSFLAGDKSPYKLVMQCEIPFGCDHLNQIGHWDPQEAGWLEWLQPWKVAKGSRSYEEKVRRVYVEIAERATRLEAAATAG